MPALRAADEGSGAIDFAASKLELATGAQDLYVGASLFPGQDSGLKRLKEAAVPSSVSQLKGPVTFEFTPRGAAARISPRQSPCASSQRARRSARSSWRSRARSSETSGSRLSCGSSPPSLSAACSRVCSRGGSPRKITGTVLALSSAAKEIAAGNYAVRVPARRSRGRDQPPVRAVQRDGLAPGGDRGA